MPEPLKLSYTKLTTYQTCQRKYYWTYVKKIVPLARQLPLEFGHAWHKAMEVWHETHDLTQAKTAFNLDYTPPSTERKRSRETGHRMLTRYAERFPAPEPFEILSQEQWIEILIGTFTYVMRVDKVVEQDGHKAGMEHKTTSSLKYHYTKSFKPNLQIAGNILGLQITLDDPEIDTMIIDAALVSVREPTDGERFLRYPETVELWEIKEFEHIVEQLGTDLSFRADVFEAFIPNWNACTLYGECPYRQLCIAAPSAREKIAQMQYQPKEESHG